MRPERMPDTTSDCAPAPCGEDGVLRLVIPANERAVRRGLMCIKLGLKGLNLNADDWSTLELVVAEIFNNIVEHAYKERSTGLIETQMNYSKGQLQCEIVDTGCSMPNGTLPQGMQKNLDCDIADLPEGGFGWFLIRQLTSHLNYDRAAGHNILTFQLSLNSDT
jgi:serine/threonine-protein kinase RsbW